MFYLEDWEVPQTTLDILEDIGLIEPDGFIWFPEERETLKAARFNSCQLYLMWTVENSFGVQLIKIGSQRLMGRGGWRALLKSKRKLANGKYCTYAEMLLRERSEKIQAVFPEEKVSFDFLGWQILSSQFWTPTPGTRKLDPMRHERAFKMEPLSHAQSDPLPKLETKANDKA